MIERPNLFEFATSELSQDAFLCWLLSWAHIGHREAAPALYGTATALIARLLALHGITAPEECRFLEVRRQHKDIDILVLVNDDIAVPIEDKTDTSEHSNQLQRYLDIVRTDPDLRGRRAAPVFVKTFDQCDYRAVEAAGWKYLGRRDLLDVLGQGERAGVASDIYHDFHQRLQGIEDVANSWRLVPVANWGQDRRRWAGFFSALQEPLPGGRWAHANNRSGGFLGFHWHWVGEAFLQLEERKLCFKIMVADVARQAEKWHEWHRRVMEAGRPAGLKPRRPDRRGTGTFMTVALLDGAYRVADEGGLINLDATVSLLHQAERLLDVAATAPRL